jgi:hypothetical protein
MTFVSSIGANAPSKPYSSFMPFPPPVLVAGSVQHELLSMPVQMTILRLVDETGSASLGDIALALGDHPNAAGAVLVMVDLGIVVISYAGTIDDHAVVCRAPVTPEPSPDVALTAETSPPSAANDAFLPDGIASLNASPLTPSVMVAEVEVRRHLGKVAALDRPGIYALIGNRQIYIGASSSVGTRVASGQQPIGDIERIVVITDVANRLTEEDALAAERMFFARVQASRAFPVMNSLPMGADVDSQRYDDLDAFLAQACLALRHGGVLFTEGSTRSVLAGPRNEMGRLAPIRPFNQIPHGDRMELCFDDGLVALAARQYDHRWVLLAGSDVRINTAISANSTTRFLRAAWLHAGLLEHSADGRSYVTTRDLVFQSGSGAAQFCVGSKGRNRDSWVPIDPDGGFDTDTPALIAA